MTAQQRRQQMAPQLRQMRPPLMPSRWGGRGQRGRIMLSWQVGCFYKHSCFSLQKRCAVMLLLSRGQNVGGGKVRCDVGGNLTYAQNPTLKIKKIRTPCILYSNLKIGLNLARAEGPVHCAPTSEPVTWLCLCRCGWWADAA